MEHSIRLFKLFGIPIRLHYTWFALFILLAFSLSSSYFPSLYKNWATSVYWIIGIIGSLLLFASIVIHELTHSLISSRYGIPVKSITLFIFGGIARITREAHRPSEELMIAISGPLSSLVLGGLFYLACYLSSQLNQPSGAMFYWLMEINIVLALFNLIPGFPLDGGRIFRSLLWHFTKEYNKATHIAFRVGRVISWLFILAGVFVALRFRVVISGLWLSLIGGFLLHALSLSQRQYRLRENLSNLSAMGVIDRRVTFIPSYITLSQLYQDHILMGGYYFALCEGERFLGVVTAEQLKAVPKDLWANTPICKIMISAQKLPSASPEETALSLLEKMLEGEASFIPVIHQDKLLGIVTKENLLRFTNLT